MQMKVLKVRYLESKKVLQNKCRLTRTEICQKYLLFFQICDPLPIGPRGSILPQNSLKTPYSQNF